MSPICTGLIFEMATKSNFNPVAKEEQHYKVLHLGGEH